MKERGVAADAVAGFARKLALWLDTVNQFSPTAGYVGGCRHVRNFLAPRLQGETEPEDCSPDVVAAITSSGQRERSPPQRPNAMYFTFSDQVVATLDAVRWRR